MAKVRIGFSTQFELENETVGIGTDEALDTLHVTGDIIAHGLDIGGGITTITTYDGFINKEVKLTNPDINLNSQSHSLSGEIVVEGEVTVSSGTTFTSGPENLTVTDNFTLPGITDDKPTVGTTRFNENLAALEFYTGVEWKAVNSYVDSGNRGRTVFAGGGSPMEYPSRVPYLSGKIMDYVQIASQGNAQDFGDLTEFIRHSAGASNHIRGLIYHGSAGPGNDNIIDKITIASSGNAVEFGLIDGTDRYESSGAATSTRCIFAGGSGPTDDIDYVEIMTDGNSKSFGDLTSAKAAGRCFNDPVRVVYCGGASLTLMETFMMASKGNGKDWGELGTIRNSHIAMSNSTRGIIGTGYGPAPAYPTQFTTESSTISTGGNTVNFGEIFSGRYGASGASQTRGLVAGGTVPGGNYKNIIEYVTISTEGNGIDFGDLTRPCYGVTGLSDSHGGLGGF